MRSPVRCVLNAAVMLAVLAAAPAIYAQTATHFTLPAQSLADSLRAVGTQANISVVFDPSLVEGRRAPAIDAQMSLDQALSRLLVGSGLTHQFLNEHTVVLAAADSKNTADASQVSDLRLAMKKLESTDAADRQKPDSSAEGSENKIQEIIVTAQKRSERLQDVPITVSVLAGEQLMSQGLVSLAEYAKLLPGVTAGSGNGTNGGGPGFGAITIRGMSTGAGGPVAVFLDDVSFAGQFFTFAFFEPDVADLDHIEVLEGPQSTLYGASAEGGIIKYVTKQPSFSGLSGNVRIDGSQVDDGGSGYGVRASVNVPVSDRIAMRASVFSRRDPGFIGNTFSGAKNLNRSDVRGGQLTVLFNISDSLQTTFSGLAQHFSTPSLNQVFIDPQTLQPSLGGLNYTGKVPANNLIDAQAVTNTTKWTLPFATLTNILAYSHFYIGGHRDLSLYTGFVGAPADFGASYANRSAGNQWTDELRLASSPGRVEYLLGAFYSHEKISNSDGIRGTDANGQVLSPSDPFFDIFTSGADILFIQKALFGNLTYHLTDKLEGTVGMRRAWNSRWQPFFQGGLLAGGSQSASPAGSDSANSYLATIGYKPNSNLTMYVRAASAYRPGYPQWLNAAQVAVGAPTQVQPDSMWNYEAGIKGTLWDSRVGFSADIFRMRWTDLQLYVTVGGLSFADNVGSALSEGVEGALEFKPTRNLTVNLKGAYIDAKITDDLPSINAVNGQPLPFSPKWTLASQADYRFTSANGMTPTVGLTYAYRGGVNSGFASTSGAFGAASGVYQLPSYSTLDLRGGVEWSRYNVLFRVNNATNKFALTSIANYPYAGYPLVGVAIQPRTYSISLGASF